MFNAKIKLIDDKQVRFRITVYVDTLYEAEICVTRLLSKNYIQKDIVLVYQYDLLYFMYEDDIKIGTVEIVLGD